MLSEVFLTSLYVASFGFLGGLLAFLYKSKCTRIKICCIDITRDVDVEQQENMLTITHAQTHEHEHEHEHIINTI